MIVIIHRNPANVNAGLINPVYGCLIGRVPLKKYQMK